MDKWREELLSHAKDPKNRDSAAIVGKAFSNPVRDTTCAGYHGCCLRALITAVNTGYLPSGLFKLSGSLYIAPSPDCFPGSSREGSIEDARGYALMITSRDIVAALIDKPYGDPLAGDLYSEYQNSNSRKLPALLERAKLTMRELDCIIEAAEGRVYGGRGGTMIRNRQQGVILGLSPAVLDDFEIERGDYGDKKIVAPNGIPLKYLAAVEPLEDGVYDALGDLQTLVESLAQRGDRS